jgi:hydroxymethylpyrimidine pyrophosphatase-like HAD family hydrolase
MYYLLRRLCTEGYAMNTFEIIKEAAKKKDRIENHKQKIKKAGTAGRVMQMAYIDKKGKYSERFVEPYKIDGDSFWGYSLDKNEIRRFKIPQIDNLKITNKKYQPRWPVEVDYEGMTKTAAQKKKYIAVDFDGTICENAFPDIGAAKKSTVEFMRIMAEEGHVIIIWTCRSGKYLDEAKAFLDKNKIPYKYINENPEVDFQTSNKIYADYYVDDKAINVNSLMDIDEYSKLQANRSYWTSKQYEFDENGKIPALEEAFSDPLEKKIAYMIATSHEYKKPNAKAAISFVKNYKWEESETSVSNLQGINKPINEEKVADMVKTINRR